MQKNFHSYCYCCRVSTATGGRPVPFSRLFPGGPFSGDGPGLERPRRGQSVFERSRRSNHLGTDTTNKILGRTAAEPMMTMTMTMTMSMPSKYWWRILLLFRTTIAMTTAQRHSKRFLDSELPIGQAPRRPRWRWKSCCRVSPPRLRWTGGIPAVRGSKKHSIENCCSGRFDQEESYYHWCCCCC